MYIYYIVYIKYIYIYNIYIYILCIYLCVCIYKSIKCNISFFCLCFFLLFFVSSKIDANFCTPNC